MFKKLGSALLICSLCMFTYGCTSKPAKPKVATDAKGKSIAGNKAEGSQDDDGRKGPRPEVLKE